MKKAENTPEYRSFKKASNEDNVLINYLSNHLSISDDTKILDVGGREGYISLSLQSPENVTIVENDPDVVIPKAPVTYFQKSIQDMEFNSESFDVIILSHVLGILGRQGSQEEMIKKSYLWLKKGGSLVLFYNTNTGYMGELLKFSKANLKKLRYDYFDEKILSFLKNTKILEKKVVTPIQYDSFEELGQACWYLFSACDDEADSDDMNTTTKIFVSSDMERWLDK